MTTAAATFAAAAATTVTSTATTATTATMMCQTHIKTLNSFASSTDI